MVAAMVEREPTPVVAVSHDVVCPRCRRWLTERRVLAQLPPAMVFSRVRCKWCHQDRWIDLVTGEVVHHPPRSLC